MLHLFVALHVFAVTLWIGSIACVGWLVSAAASAPGEKEGATAAELAFGLYRRAASPAFGIAFFTGLAQLLADSSTYMSLHWMHLKLTAAVAVIALHHIIGAKARKASSGSRQAGRSSAILTGATLACAFVVVTVAVLKGQLIP
jgi:protoporphyrinogen IX oxidase